MCSTRNSNLFSSFGRWSPGSSWRMGRNQQCWRIASSVVLTRAWTIPTEPPVPIVHSGLAEIANRVSAFNKGPRYHYEVTAG